MVFFTLTHTYTMQRYKIQTFFGSIIALAAAFAVVPSPASAMVHAGDTLQVTVYNHPELSRKVIVDASDTLSLPLAGTIVVRGLGAAEIASRISAALQAFVRNPAVDVEMADRNASIFVSGGPGGVLKYLPGETLAAGLADISPVASASPVSGAAGHMGIAGLERSRVDLHHVQLQRDGALLGPFDATALSAQGNGGPELLPGDTIILVNKEKVVHVLGDVARPGDAYLSKDETLANAIEQAGGVTASAASAQIELARHGKTQFIALGDPLMQQAAENDDVLTIPTAPRVSVVGLVEKPGPVVLKTDFSLLNALFGAGGPAKYGDLANVSVIHAGVSHSYNVAALLHGDTGRQNPALSDGDTVFVPRSNRIDYGGLFQTLSPLLYLFRPF